MTKLLPYLPYFSVWSCLSSLLHFWDSWCWFICWIQIHIQISVWDIQWCNHVLFNKCVFKAVVQVLIWVQCQMKWQQYWSDLIKNININHLYRLIQDVQSKQHYKFIMMWIYQNNRLIYLFIQQHIINQQIVTSASYFDW